jgi:predicted TPR repeat methyltransferase
MPLVDYVGFDMSARYIRAAQRRYSDRGRFECKKVTRDAIDDIGGFDLVLATGVLHHLTDAEAIELFALADASMKSTGRLVTFDGCFVAEQSRLSRYIVARDRGQYVRTNWEYERLARAVFQNVKATVRHDLLNIPYAHLILECRK